MALKNEGAACKKEGAAFMYLCVYKDDILTNFGLD
jgi:hypothetical protein